MVYSKKNTIMSITHEKTVTNPAGDKIKIDITFWISGNTPQYSISLYKCPKGKRKFTRVDFDNWEFRALDMIERQKYFHTKYLELVTQEQLDEAKKELWLKLVPEKAQTNF